MFKVLDEQDSHTAKKIIDMAFGGKVSRKDVKDKLGEDSG
jgi:hypothetical protein